MPLNVRDVLGGEGEELVQDEAKCFPSAYSPLLLRLGNTNLDDLPSVENEDFQSPIALGSTLILVRAAPEWTRSAKLKVTSMNSATSVEAGDEPQPFVEVFFRLKCAGSAEKIRLKLVLDQIDIGVKNSCSRNCSARNRRCGPKCKTAFIHQLTIEIGPKMWSEVDCRRSTLQPHHTAEVFGLQQNSSIVIQIPFVNPKQASISYQSGDAVSQTALAYGFSPARKTDSGVTWSWEVDRFTNGTKLELDKARWGSKPVLAIPPDHLQIHPESFRAEVEWELEPHAALQSRLQLEPVEFDCQVNLHTAVFASKRRLPAYSVTTGRTVTLDTVLSFHKK